jgi:hypothetical protein
MERVRFASVVLILSTLVATVPAQAPSNNECASAITVSDGINPSAPFGVSGTTFTNVSATNSANFGVSCSSATHFNKDVFFSYTATCTGTTTFSTCTPAGFTAGSLNDTVLDIYDSAACPAGGASLACNDQFCGSLSEVTLATTVGTTYLIRIGSWSTVSAGTFYLTITPPGTSNDECAGATPLVPGNNTGFTDCATASAPVDATCTGFTTPVADVWHTFTPAINCLLKLTMSGPGANRIGLFTGTCGALTAADCDSLAVYDVQLQAIAGTTYYVRVGRSVAPGADNSYSIVVDCSVLGTNDECTGATPVAEGINPSAPFGANGLTFTNVGATESAGFAASSACAGAGHPGTSDVFFVYTSMVDGPVTVANCTPPGFAVGSLSDTILEVYDGSACPVGGVAALACNDQFCGGLSSTTFNATFGATYYVRVSTWSTSTTNEGSFYLTIEPANDTCAAAQVVGTGMTHGSTANADATSPNPAGACGSATDADVWYSFTTATKCDLNLSVSGSGANRLGVYTGTCGAPVLAVCDSSGALNQTIPNAPAGTTYLIRVGQSAAANVGPFVLNIVCPALVNDDCTGAIAVFDGINPSPPSGVSGMRFTNVGATTSGLFAAPGTCPGSGPGHPGQSDVFFTYTSTCTGMTRISLCVPTGFTGSDYDSILEVYDATTCPAGSAAPLACNDQASCGSLSELTTPTVAGVTYLIRVSSWSTSETAESSFYLTIDPDLCLVMDGPLGPGSLRVRNVSGPPNAACITIITLFAGNYPNGLFFGIDPTYVEIIQQASSGIPPFIQVLDGGGNSTFGPIAGLPPLTLYGVSLALNGLGQIGDVSPPTTFTIP